jgi:hypothetical protein
VIFVKEFLKALAQAPLYCVGQASLQMANQGISLPVMFVEQK